MENIRPFQIALLAGFAFLGILSLIFLVNFKGFSSNNETPYGDSVEIWGVLDEDIFNDYIDAIVAEDKLFKVVSYTQIDSRVFESNFVDALAEGQGPDLVVVSSDMFTSLRNKLVPISYETSSLRNYRDLYIDGTEIFAQSDGIYAIPFAVDPLVMYWNRDLFAAAGLVEPPQTWELLLNKYVPVLNKRDNSRNLTQSAVAFGEYENIRNAVPIMLTLAMQAGSKIVTADNNKYVVSLNVSGNEINNNPFTTAMQFYMDFSNRNSLRHSWDLSRPLDYNAFLGQRLAVYFGFGSEWVNIQQDNPNLNFDIAVVPQGAGAIINRTYGNHYGLSVVRNSGNMNGAYAVAQRLASSVSVASLTDSLEMASVSRQVLGVGTDNFFKEVINKAALNAYGWLSPNPDMVLSVFKEFIADITSNRESISAATSKLINRLTQAF